MQKNTYIEIRAQERFSQIETLSRELKFKVGGKPWQHIFDYLNDGSTFIRTNWVGSCLMTLVDGVKIIEDEYKEYGFTEPEERRLRAAGLKGIHDHICRKNELKKIDEDSMMDNIQKGLNSYSQAVGALIEKGKKDRVAITHDVARTARTGYLDFGKEIGGYGVQELFSKLTDSDKETIPRELRDKSLEVLFKDSTGHQCQLMLFLMEYHWKKGGPTEIVMPREVILDLLGYQDNSDTRTIQRVENEIRDLARSWYKVAAKGKDSPVKITAGFFPFSFEILGVQMTKGKDRRKRVMWKFHGFSDVLFSASPEEVGYINISTRPFIAITSAEDSRIAGYLKKIILRISIEAGYYTDGFTLSSQELGVAKVDIPKLSTRNSVKEKLTEYVKKMGWLMTPEGNEYSFEPVKQPELGL